MQADDLARRLEPFFHRRIPHAEAVRVRRVERHPEGFSQEVFDVELEVARGGSRESRRVAIKREPASGLLEPYDLEPEFRVLRGLGGAELRAPAVLWLERDAAVLDRPFYVMEHVSGTVPSEGESSEGPFASAQRAALARDVAEELAALHAVDWRARGFDFLGVPRRGPEVARTALATWERRIDAADLPVPAVLSEALLWLRASLPHCDEVTLVHGDYRLGNWVVAGRGGQSRLAGILDWELVHLGDPLEDLAWLLSPMWRAGTPWAAALVPPAELAELYAKASGRELEPTRLQFYGVLSVVKMIAIQLTGLRAFSDGRSRDIKLATFDHLLPRLVALLATVRGYLPVPVPGGVSIEGRLR